MVFLFITGLTLNLVYLPTTNRLPGLFMVVVFCYLAVLGISALLFFRIYMRLKGYQDFKEDMMKVYEEKRPQAEQFLAKGKVAYTMALDYKQRFYDPMENAAGNVKDAGNSVLDTLTFGWWMGDPEKDKKPKGGDLD